jgi:hypothetical protein
MVRVKVRRKMVRRAAVVYRRCRRRHRQPLHARGSGVIAKPGMAGGRGRSQVHRHVLGDKQVPMLFA